MGFMLHFAHSLAPVKSEAGAQEQVQPSVDTLMHLWREDGDLRDRSKLMADQWMKQLEEFGFQIKPPNMKGLNNVFELLKTRPANAAFEEA